MAFGDGRPVIERSDPQPVFDFTDNADAQEQPAPVEDAALAINRKIYAVSVATDNKHLCNTQDEFFDFVHKVEDHMK